jgi:toxin-antitoxin system PIN domain toxin
VKTALLDVNLLIALLWPAHEHHEAAHRWFGARRSKRWATCPLTQLAFVRIVSNPSFSTDAITPEEAVALLEKNLQDQRHELRPDDLGVVEALAGVTARICGHRQVTDAYLLALASTRGDILASFDSGIQAFASAQRSSALEIVPVK